MSVPITAPCNYQANANTCDCTFSSLGNGAPVTATKVLDDFQFYSIRGLGGITVTPNPGNGTVDISGGAPGVASLQTAYNNGFSIAVAASNPVDISGSNVSPQTALLVHDASPLGFSVATTNVTGSPDVEVTSMTGLAIHPPLTNVAAPVSADPLLQLTAGASPNAVLVTDTIASAANIGSATAANDVYSHLGAANEVTMFDVDIVGYSAALSASFSIKAIGKLSPSSVIPVMLTSTANSIDAALVGISVDVRYTSNTLHISLIGGPVGVQYLIRNSARLTVLRF